MLALLTIAQSRGEQDPGSTGLGIGLIAAVLVLLVLGAIALHFLMHRRSRASRGGVQAPREDGAGGAAGASAASGAPEGEAERHPSQPPLESIEPRS